jgi:von Willebrand factor type A domain
MNGHDSTPAPVPTTLCPAPPAPPRDRQRRALTYLLLAAGAAVVLAAIGMRHRGSSSPPIANEHAPARLPAAAVTAQPRRPRVELVFALDTTGSMTGLIEGAKRKIWSLASFVARGQPTPDLRVGVVAYRDIGDQYVTRVFDLDDDLDRVYARLRQLRADGGGDGPEHVARALHEAVHRMSWTDRQDVVRVIYLVGDAPPHTDYHDGYDVLAAARAAGRRGIAVHTIRCGDDPATESSWRRIAELGRGQFLTIRQDGGMTDETTPYDAELGRLHDAVSRTALGYGPAAAAVAVTAAASAESPAPTKADRVAFMARKGRAIAGSGDLVDDFASGQVSLESVPEAAMPATLRGLDRTTAASRLQEVKRNRDELLDKASALSREREAFLERKARAATAGGEADGFDAAAKRALRKTVSDNPRAGLRL